MASALFFVGVDVGTASVRAGLFDEHGRNIAVASRLIQIWNPQTNFYEQSSDDIWNACCEVVKQVTRNVDANNIKGIGFDATCSLVVLGENKLPISISPSGKSGQNIIMWMDHRAQEETETVNATQHPAFRFVGGKVSIEMQLPKLLWMKKNIPEIWDQIGLLFDLPDFLTWKATGSEARSQCSVVCKWNYVADHGWPKDLLEQIGLEDLLKNEATLIGKEVNIPGSSVGKGLSDSAAQELGLNPGTAVGVSLIDAYAGALGLLACNPLNDVPAHHRLAMICGTSSCHMLLVPNPLFVPGVWGPYAGVLLPDYWLLEAGQSATGKLLDHVIQSHPVYEQMQARLMNTSRSFPEEIVAVLEAMAARSMTSITRLTNELHMWPDFHGNRSPLADPNLKGAICGLTLDNSEENLALMYLAAVQALVYGTRHIIDALKNNGATVEHLLLCGGLTKSQLFVSTMADATGMPVIVPHEPESVLLGSAMLGGCASKHFSSLRETMKAMGGPGTCIQPDKEEKPFHDRKYRVFLKMLQDQKDYKEIMNSK